MECGECNKWWYIYTSGKEVPGKRGMTNSSQNLQGIVGWNKVGNGYVTISVLKVFCKAGQ